MNFRGSKIDLVGKLNLWFGISVVLILVGLVSWAAFGLNLGIDFKGGGLLQYRIPYDKRPASGQDAALINEVRGLLSAKDLKKVRIQVAGGNTLVIATDARGEDELRSQDRMIRAALTQQLTGKDAQGNAQAATDPQVLLGRQLVGPVIGEELRRNAINGVLLGVLMIAAWIYIRYNFAGDGLRYAAGGIVALVHDVLVLIGIFALIGRIDERVEIDGAFIAALLTVVGYSINDSVVIFDRIRENLRTRRKEPFNTVVNDSLLETMSRSINTGLTVLIMLVVLLFWGGESIYNFVLAMLVGIASGLYSSIFNASMVLVAWHNYDEKKAAEARAQRATVRGAGRTVTMRDGAPSRVGQPALAGVNQPSLPTSPANTTSRPANTGPRETVTPTVTPAVTPVTDGEAGSISASSSEVTGPAGTAPGGNGDEPNGSSTASDRVGGGSAASSAARPPRKARSKRRY